jgi:hypothetical protein
MMAECGETHKVGSRVESPSSLMTVIVNVGEVEWRRGRRVGSSHCMGMMLMLVMKKRAMMVMGGLVNVVFGGGGGSGGVQQRREGAQGACVDGRPHESRRSQRRSPAGRTLGQMQHGPLHTRPSSIIMIIIIIIVIITRRRSSIMDARDAAVQLRISVTWGLRSTCGFCGT